MSMLGRFALRALAGGAAGGIMTGNWGGVAGGAAVAGLGGGMMSRYGRGLNFAGGIGRGLGFGSRMASIGAISRNFGKIDTGLSRMGLGTNITSKGFTKIGQGLSSARGFVGSKSIVTNKIGGYAMASMGAGAGAYIGSTVLSSNRGY